MSLAQKSYLIDSYWASWSLCLLHHQW